MCLCLVSSSHTKIFESQTVFLTNNCFQLFKMKTCEMVMMRDQKQATFKEERKAWQQGMATTRQGKTLWREEQNGKGSVALLLPGFMQLNKWSMKQKQPQSFSKNCDHLGNLDDELLLLWAMLLCIHCWKWLWCGNDLSMMQLRCWCNWDVCNMLFCVKWPARWSLSAELTFSHHNHFHQVCFDF